MKKLILGACAALMFAGVSCSNGNDAEKLPKELNDSISEYSGRYLGASVLGDYLSYTARTDREMSKEDVLKGIQIAFANGENEGVIAGIQTGAQILGNLRQLEEQGVEIDYNKFLKAFREEFEAEEFDRESLAVNSGVMNSLVSKVQQIQEEREQAAQAEQQQTAADEAAAYIAQLKAADGDIQTSASGLSYKIISAGEEPRVQDNSQVTLYYTGKLADGTVFDQTQEGSPATFAPGNVIPGFAEGLKMLGKGGKAILYIPGELGYGATGVPQAGIGPNAMLIFEVEVVDVNTPE